MKWLRMVWTYCSVISKKPWCTWNWKRLEAALAKLKTLSQHVVITLSAEGALISNAQETFNVVGRKVHAIDANGAGDAFAGAFLYAVNAGLGLHTAAQLAIWFQVKWCLSLALVWLWQITLVVPTTAKECAWCKNLHDGRHPRTRSALF